VTPSQIETEAALVRRDPIELHGVAAPGVDYSQPLTLLDALFGGETLPRALLAIGGLVLVLIVLVIS
jgi:hypothetical protein